MSTEEVPGEDNVFEVRETVRNLKKCLECPICLELLDEPCKTRCLHQFCKKCIITVLSSNKKPKCPLCKEPISRRGLTENSVMSDLVSAVKELNEAVLQDAGITVLSDTLGTPSQPINHRHQARGTPGMTLHSALYPTPHKPVNKHKTT